MVFPISSVSGRSRNFNSTTLVLEITENLFSPTHSTKQNSSLLIFKILKNSEREENVKRQRKRFGGIMQPASNGELFLRNRQICFPPRLLVGFVVLKLHKRFTLLEESL